MGYLFVILLLVVSCASKPYFDPIESSDGAIVHSKCPPFDSVDYNFNKTKVRMVANPITDKPGELNFDVYFLLAEGDSFQVLTPALSSVSVDVKVTQWNTPYTNKFDKLEIPTPKLTYRTFDPEYIKHLKSFGQGSFPTLNFQFTFNIKNTSEVIEVTPPIFKINDTKVTPAKIKFKLKNHSSLHGC